MSTTATGTAGSSDGAEIVDVWSRTTPRYRRRSVLMLIVLALLFAGLCCFTFWLRTGDYQPWSSESYADILGRSFSPVGSDQITLSDFLSSPISVKDVWVHGIIMGLLLATLSSIPVLVAILYRFPFSIVFAVMVMFLAAMPWLGMTVLLGCALASLRPLRFSFRYASALVGLIPIAIYFISASWEPSDSGSRLIPHQALLYAPWVLAVLGSCIICALALAIARLIDYRPGGIPPVLAMLFAIPVFLFHTQVGRDELEYQLLEQEIGPGSRVLFEMRDLGAEAAREATRRWSQSKSRAYDEIRQAELESAVRRVQDQTEIDRDRAVGRCDSFIRNFPKSRYVPNVLFLKGRVQDQRLQRQRLEQDHRAEFRCAVANRASRTTWETLAEKFPDSVLSATALYKLAGLNVRAGQEGIDVALEVLGELRGRFDLAQANTQVLESSGQVRASVFRRAPAPAGLGLEATVLVRQGRRLEEMLVACREDEQKPYSELFGPRSGGPEVLIHPMQLLLWLDDTDPRYQANLEGIARHFADSQTEGYVEIRLALMERAVSRRIQRFQNVARSLVGQPAGAEALFYLGDALEEDSILDGAKAAFEELTEQYPESCWAEEAQERLSSVAMLQAPME